MINIDTSKTQSVSLEDIEKLLDNSHVVINTPYKKEVLVTYELLDRAGYTITGRGAVTDSNKFDYEIGKQVARRDAITQLAKLEGYLKQLELAGIITFNK